MDRYRLINKVDCSNYLNKNVALSYDAGKVRSEKYGEAMLSGHFLLMRRHGEFPEVNVKEVEDRARSWIMELGLAEEEDEVLKCVNLANIPSMVAHIAPTGNPEKLKLCFMIIVFLFLFDDTLITLKGLKENNPIAHQEDIIRLAKSLISIIVSDGDSKATSNAASENPMFRTTCIALSDVCKDSLNMIDKWTGFARELINCALVNKWEQEYRNVSYTEKEFFLIRRVNSGVTLVLDSICFANDIVIPPEIRVHPIFQRYRSTAIMHVALSNDVLSLQKELADGERENFVMVKCSKYSLQQSIHRAEKEVNRLLIEVKRDGMKLKSYFPTDKNLENFIQATENMIDGFLYWYRHSRRYGNIKFEQHVVEYDDDTNVWFEKIGITNQEIMKEPVP